MAWLDPAFKINFVFEVDNELAKALLITLFKRLVFVKFDFVLLIKNE